MTRLCFVLILACLAGCGGEGASSARGAAEEILEGIADKDAESLYRLLSQRLRRNFQKKVANLTEKEKRELPWDVDPNDAEGVHIAWIEALLTNLEYDGGKEALRFEILFIDEKRDRAKVAIKNVHGQSYLGLVKEGDRWYLDSEKLAQ